jgi:hypothetical protein
MASRGPSTKLTHYPLDIGAEDRRTLPFHAPTLPALTGVCLPDPEVGPPGCHNRLSRRPEATRARPPCRYMNP